MSQFKVKTEQVKKIAEIEKIYYNEISSYESSVNQICNSLVFQISAAANIKARLRKVSNNLDAEKSTMKKMHQGLSSIADCYERTEKKICDASEDGKISFIEAISGESAGLINNNIPIIGLANCALVDLLLNDEVTEFVGYQKKFDVSDKINDYIKDKFDKSFRKKWTNQGYWENGTYHKVNQASEEEKEKFENEKLKKEATIYSVGDKVEKSFWLDKDGKLSGECGELSGEVNAGTVEAHANAYAGLYSVSPDGEKMFAPGIGAEIGCSASAFTAGGMALLGDDMAGLYVKGDVAAGKVGAKAGLDLGLFENGEFNPQANVSAQAEAILVEGTAAVGAKLLGSDVSGSVGVNVGVGAHADIGLKDGKINFDVGASLGVGVSVDLEIDLSGTIDKVGTFVSDCSSAIGDFFD